MGSRCLGAEYVFICFKSSLVCMCNSGMLFWKIFTNVKVSYDGREPAEVRTPLTEGRRLQMPPNCPGSINELVTAM